jgi:hypothetical protein
MVADPAAGPGARSERHGQGRSGKLNPDRAARHLHPALTQQPSVGCIEQQ